MTMPTRARKPCGRPRCGALNVPGSPYCAQHQDEDLERKRAYDATRPTARERGYGRAWERASKDYLREHPLCEPCLAQDITEQADCVDHKIPHRGDMVLFWKRSNWQSMSKTCHDRKTATEDSSFARRGARRSGP